MFRRAPLLQSPPRRCCKNHTTVRGGPAAPANPCIGGKHLFVYGAVLKVRIHLSPAESRANSFRQFLAVLMSAPYTSNQVPVRVSDTAMYRVGLRAHASVQVGQHRARKHQGFDRGNLPVHPQQARPTFTSPSSTTDSIVDTTSPL